jgi:hypothetical protein
MKEEPTMPVFTLLAKDRLAIEVIEFWMLRARAEGVNAGKLVAVQRHLDAMIAYREAFPNRMQLPD